MVLLYRSGKSKVDNIRLYNLYSSNVDIKALIELPKLNMQANPLIKIRGKNFDFKIKENHQLSNQNLTDRINILFLAHNFNMGGVQKANIIMLNALDKKLFNIFVLYGEEGVLFREISNDIVIHKTVKVSQKAPLSIAKCLIDIIKFIKQRKIEILHTIDPNFYYIGSIAARITGIKHVRTQPNFILSSEPKNAKYLKITPFEKWTHIYITYQHKAAKELNRTGVNIEKIITLQYLNNLDSTLYFNTTKCIREELNIPQQNKIILAMHRMVDDKGYEIFIDMIPHIITHYPNVTFLLVGDGAKKKEYEYRANKLGISKYVLFTGFRKDMVNIIKQVDFGVYPLAKSAAMVDTITSGKVLITKKNSSMDEYIIHGETGYLVEEDTPEAYANYALRLLKNPVLLYEMEENQIKFVTEHLDGAKNIKILENLFLSLCVRAGQKDGVIQDL